MAEQKVMSAPEMNLKYWTNYDQKKYLSEVSTGLEAFIDKEFKELYLNNAELKKMELEHEKAEAVFAYEGFDFRRIMALNHKIICQAIGLPEKTPLSNPYVMQMLYFECGIYVTRGSNLAGKTETMSKEAKGIWDNLVNAGLKSKVVNKSLDVNLARVASVYPHIVAYMLATYKQVRVVEKIPEWPTYLSFPGCFALIPRDDDRLFKLAFKWAQAFDKTVNTGVDSDGKSRSETPEKKLQQITVATFQQGIFTDAQRRAILKKLADVDVHKEIQISL